MKRFATPINEAEIKTMIEEKIPRDTKRKEKWAVKMFEDWMTSRNSKGLLPDEQLHVFKPIKELTKSETDYLLQFFFLEIRTENGERFKGSTLKNIAAMIQYFYNKNLNHGWSIFKDAEFQNTRNSLDLAMKLSRESGVDGKKKRAEVIEIEQEEALWNKKILGGENPKQLVSTLVYLLGKNFALRGRDEHRRMQMDNVRKEYDHLAGRNYLLYVENIAKTSKGGLYDHKREPKSSRAYDNPKCPERCIVRLYEKYLSHRPDGINDFYLTPLPSGSQTETIWYKKCPIGVNTLSNVTKDLFKQAGIQGNFTNHSLKSVLQEQYWLMMDSDEILLSKNRTLIKQ